MPARASLFRRHYGSAVLGPESSWEIAPSAECRRRRQRSLSCRSDHCRSMLVCLCILLVTRLHTSILYARELSGRRTTVKRASLAATFQRFVSRNSACYIGSETCSPRSALEKRACAMLHARAMRADRCFATVQNEGMALKTSIGSMGHHHQWNLTGGRGLINLVWREHTDHEIPHPRAFPASWFSPDRAEGLSCDLKRQFLTLLDVQIPRRMMIRPALGCDDDHLAAAIAVVERRDDDPAALAAGITKQQRGIELVSADVATILQISNTSAAWR